jgi:hypothetical protein
MRDETRGGRAIRWVERFCLEPSGGQMVQLSKAERTLICAIYDDGRSDVAVPLRLAAFLALFHIAGHEWKSPCPVTEPVVDSWTLWRCVSPRLRPFLRRHGERIVCPELGTS